MKKPEITPGKWQNRHRHICFDDGQHIEINEAGMKSVPQCIANLKAIAALPDLLEALEGALDRINAANDHQRAAFRLEYATHDIIAALTKAGYTF